MMISGLHVSTAEVNESCLFLTLLMLVNKTDTGDERLPLPLALPYGQSGDEVDGSMLSLVFSDAHSITPSVTGSYTYCFLFTISLL